MRIRRGFLNWGVFLVCLGAVPLAVQLGALDRELAGGILRLWPLILIGIGLGLLLRFTSLDALGGVVVAGTFGLLFGVLFAGGFPSAAAACASDSTASGRTIERSGTLGGELGLNVELTCAEMEVGRTPGGAWSANVRAGNQTPTIESTASSLDLRSASNGGWGPFGGAVREHWEVMLPTESNLSANITVNAGTLRATLGLGALRDVNATFNGADGVLDLGGYWGVSGPAVTLNSTLNASSVSLWLPGGVSSTANVTLNAASLEVCAPADVGLRITYDDTLSSQNFGAAGLVQSGKTWQSTNYPTATARAELHISANISSTTLNPAGGCQ